MATEPISAFFKRLGFPLRNDRNSWGARNGQAVLLRTWSDEYSGQTHKVLVLNASDGLGGTAPSGLRERKEHLRELLTTSVPGFVVIVDPVTKPGRARAIGGFREDVVFPIERIVDEGNLYAILGRPMASERLVDPSSLPKVAFDDQPLPAILVDQHAAVDSLDEPGMAAYKAQAVRPFLIEAARRGVKVTYREVFDAFDTDRMTVGRILGKLGHECIANGEPILSALVVQQETGRCSSGFEREFQVDEDEERQRVFSHWGTGASTAAGSDWTDEELKASVAAYAEMMELDRLREPFVKAAYYRDLAKRFGRAEGAYGQRMQNISSILDDQGLPWLPGLRPLPNTGTNVKAKLLPLLDALIAQVAPAIQFAEELDERAGVIEGAKKTVTVNAYERDHTAKPRCIKKWGTVCAVCDFNFGLVYGELGEGFIHVHHLTPIHTIGEAYVLDPEKDLRPVCPNCHAMLHRQKEVMCIEKLKGLLKRKFNSAFIEARDPAATT